MQQELEAMRKALVIRNYATKTVNTYYLVLNIGYTRSLEE